MKLAQRWTCFRNRGFWTDPMRRVRTLESFAETGANGGEDLLAASRRTLDPELRQHLERHADDEVRHAAIFRRLAAELREEIAVGRMDAVRSEESARASDLSRGRRGEVDGHGSYPASRCDDLGEVAYVAMLHVAARRAQDAFAVHRELNADHPGIRAAFAEILRDENDHVAYTGRLLDRWRQEGRGSEVDAGLRSARSSRFMGAWKRLGIRSGAGFSHALLVAMYWTVLLPFGLVRWAPRRTPVFAGRRPADLRSQY